MALDYTKLGKALVPLEPLPEGAYRTNFMANPIQPAGGGLDIFESARQQDEERRLREARDHYERTGERLPDYVEPSPLVDEDQNRHPDVANDGDSYAERLIQRATNDVQREIDQRLFDSFSQMIPDSGNRKAESLAKRQKAIDDAVARVEKQRKERQEEMQKLECEAKQKFNSAISGLDIGEEE